MACDIFVFPFFFLFCLMYLFDFVGLVYLFIYLVFCTGMLLLIYISKVLKRQNNVRRHFTMCCLFSFPFWYSVLERYQCFSLSTYLNLIQSLNPVYEVVSRDIIWWTRYGGILASFIFLCNTKHLLKIMSLCFLFSQVRVFSIERHSEYLYRNLFGFLNIQGKQILT